MPIVISFVILAILLLTAVAIISINLDKYTPMIFIAIIVLGISFATKIDKEVKSKKPLTPSVTVTCNNGICDTTYTYKQK